MASVCALLQPLLADITRSNHICKAQRDIGLQLLRALDVVTECKRLEPDRSTDSDGRIGVWIRTFERWDAPWSKYAGTPARKGYEVT